MISITRRSLATCNNGSLSICKSGGVRFDLPRRTWFCSALISRNGGKTSDPVSGGASTGATSHNAAAKRLHPTPCRVERRLELPPTTQPPHASIRPPCRWSVDWSYLPQRSRHTPPSDPRVGGASTGSYQAKPASMPTAEKDALRQHGGLPRPNQPAALFRSRQTAGANQAELLDR
jgi:hypothetical protein